MGAGPGKKSRISTGRDGWWPLGQKEQREQEGRQKSQDWLENTESSSWAALDTGNEARAQCISFTTALPLGPTVEGMKEHDLIGLSKQNP